MNGEILIEGAVYDIHTEKVEFLKKLFYFYHKKNLKISEKIYNSSFYRPSIT